MSLLGAYFSQDEIRRMPVDVRNKIEDGIRYGVMVQPRTARLTKAGIRTQPKKIITNFDKLKKSIVTKR